ncbi:MAG: hypothetical protein EPS19_03445 [Candidatus Liberibacter solanacearum]|uniref:hypothetical protein n=1 Tax=Candidatus Liberibacter solanacearum TaxID=556287 RepID=UPI001177C59A|nr:hypothetical protein [Candidatus Liberibacter solanacearum]
MANAQNERAYTFVSGKNNLLSKDIIALITPILGSGLGNVAKVVTPRVNDKEDLVEDEAALIEFP